MNANRVDIPGLVIEGGRLFVPVGWDRADDVRGRLERVGIAAVLERNAATHEARVEVPADTDPAVLREAVDGPPR